MIRRFRPFAAGSAAAAVISITAVPAGAGGPSTGHTPLSELGTGLYQGFQGGLYPGGTNTPPAAHAAAAMSFAQQIVPRSASGQPDPNGWIVMIAIGMSNTTHEFSVFERQEDLNSSRNGRVVIINTAQGGQSASVIAPPTAPYWTLVLQRLAAMGLSAQQVQVAWLKEANAGPPNNFPVHAQELRDDLRSIAQNLHDKFPSLRLCYLSSRVYGGYAGGSLNPEPQAYESGFSVKWLIEDQINGDPALNYSSARGPVESPLLLWGPYLWADGIVPRADGLVWLQGDFEADGTHPAPSGEQKVADMLSAFFPAEPSAQPWWPAQGRVQLLALDAAADAFVRSTAPDANFGAAADLRVSGPGGSAVQASFLKFDAATASSPVMLAKLSLRITSTGGGGGTVSRVPDTSWSESTLTYGNAPAIGGPPLAQVPDASRDGTLAANVTASLNGDADGLVSLAITTTSAGERVFHSREAGQPPRLVLVLPAAPAPGDINGDGVVDISDLLLLLAAWGPCPNCELIACDADLNGDCAVDVTDLLLLLQAWS
jgi:hypothetical protein